ncbi:DUF1566 domain-containing protein [Nitrospira sp. NS4]|uniref:Lcl C-terminal domain-containing protein n=1 Tax=Nitrospira sp. NS4 TaxID=3414498 RepID=UPI003C2AD8F8
MRKEMRCRGFIVGLLSLGLFFVAALAAGSAQAQTTRPGPYYATPSWDQTLPAARRFIILSNFNSEAVLDQETGLVWERSPRDSSYSGVAGDESCTGGPIAGRYGWRLPSVHELASLLDPANHDPALPTGHPFINVKLAPYWSATKDVFVHTDGWVVDFRNGTVSSVALLEEAQHWCVRGEINAGQF